MTSSGQLAVEAADCEVVEAAGYLGYSGQAKLDVKANIQSCNFFCWRTTSEVAVAVMR